MKKLYFVKVSNVNKYLTTAAAEQYTYGVYDSLDKAVTVMKKVTGDGYPIVVHDKNRNELLWCRVWISTMELNKDGYNETFLMAKHEMSDKKTS